MTEVKQKYIRIVYEDGKEISSTSLEEVQILRDNLAEMPSISKKDDYLVLDNSIIFLDRVDQIIFQLP